jgi:thiol-disulfide isomerase/thioredoxin
MRNIVFALALAISFVPSGAAQPADIPPPPNAPALKVLRDSEKAIQGIRTFRYNARAYALGPAARSMGDVFTGMVSGERPTDANAVPRFRIELKCDTRQQTIICDGKKMFVTEGGGRSYALLDAKDAERLDTVALMLMRELTLPEPFVDELFSGKPSYIRQESFDGRKLDVVQVQFQGAENSEWSIDIADQFPRRVRRTFGKPPLPSVFILELIDFEANPKLPDHVFTLPSTAVMGYAALPVGWKISPWRLPTPEGDEVDSSSLAGKVVVLHFWSLWSMPSRAFLPTLQALQNEFGSKEFKLFAVNSFERGGDPVATLADNGFTFPVLLQGEGLAQQFLVTDPPALYVIGPDGRVLYASVESRDSKAVRDAVMHGLTLTEPIQRPTTNPAAK